MIEAALRDIGLDLEGEAGLMLLAVAGPYAWRDGWFEDTSTGAFSAAEAALNAALARFGAPSTADLVAELGLLGMAADVAEDFVKSRPGLRRFGDRWVRWGTSVADKAVAVLHVSGVPATAEMIAAAIGENYHPRAVREALYGDHRFARTTRRTWALREWGLDEYGGVFSEIVKRIDVAGGVIEVETVVADMRTCFPDVAEISVRTYLAAAPGFVTEGGMVRKRTAADGWPTVPPLRSVRRVFCNGRNEIRVALAVTRDLLRGSGQQVHPAVAAALGIHPGEHRLFSGPHGAIKLAWHLSTTRGPSVGSLRALAASVGAELGDTVVLVFNLRDNAIDVARITAGESPHCHLQALLGKPAQDPIPALARALDCRPHQVTSILRDRGDNEVLELIEHDFRLAQKRTDLACG
ncbi:hypothetical protein MSM1_20305 [Mycobacterium sp. SM1]|uniref:hypothetical protein n=1 Tax=Mycobacterium sp. SM1 TaxID=2816243 RepID=UPI001BD0FC4A|nr:hypothetical protein [Mycobacterium sp. SM1]MBS4730562.1 hypothetical protein [Mycobacterium sp. SM1]